MSTEHDGKSEVGAPARRGDGTLAELALPRGIALALVVFAHACIAAQHAVLYAAEDAADRLALAGEGHQVVEYDL
jgi:hypothetical protein